MEKQRHKCASETAKETSTYKISFDTVASPLYIYWMRICIDRLLISGGSTMYTIELGGDGFESKTCAKNCQIARKRIVQFGNWRGNVAENKCTRMGLLHT